MLQGRRTECAALDRLLAAARAGQSGALGRSRRGGRWPAFGQGPLREFSELYGAQLEVLAEFVERAEQLAGAQAR